MKYQIADLHNGPFGDIFNSVEAAEKALAEAIKEGKQLNRENSEDGSELGSDGSPVESFFSIVEV